MTVSRTRTADLHPMDDFGNTDVEAAFFFRDLERPRPERRRILPLAFTGFGVVSTVLCAMLFAALAFGDELLRIGQGTPPVELHDSVVGPG